MLESIATNLESAESRLIWHWRFVTAVALVYLFMFVRIQIHPEIAEVQEKIRALEAQRVATQRLHLYKDAYLIAGARAIRSKLERDDPPPPEMDAECRKRIPDKPAEEDVTEALRQCPTWTLVRSLLLDPDSFTPAGNLGDSKYLRHSVRQHFPVISEAEIEDFPRATGLVDIPNWNTDVLGAFDRLPSVQAESQADYDRRLSTLATGRITIPLWQEVIDPLLFFWVGCAVIAAALHSMIGAWDTRHRLFQRLQQNQTTPITWDVAVTLYQVQLPWLLPRSPSSPSTVLVARSMFVLVLFSLGCIAFYCWSYPRTIHVGWRILATAWSLAAAALALVYLRKLWQRTSTALLELKVTELTDST